MKPNNLLFLPSLIVTKEEGKRRECLSDFLCVL